MRLLLYIFLLLANTAVLFSQKTDPYHRNTGGYGKQLLNNDKLVLWWCEGAYKVMPDTPLPDEKSKSIKINAAKNEYEPFQLIIQAADTLHNILITIDNLKGPYGEISADNFEFRSVEYVNITKPSDEYAYKGMWPDPLPILKDSISLLPGTNSTFWINLYIPAGSMPGIYKTTLRLSADGWSEKVPLKLEVWDFTLPKEASIRSGFGLSVDKIAAYHNISDQSDLEETFDLYMKAFRDYKISPYNFYYLSPIAKKTAGVNWEGGYYDSKIKFQGKYSLRIEDSSYTSAENSKYSRLVDIDNSINYTLRWKSRSLQNDQQYTIVIEGYDFKDNLLVFETKADIFEADTLWKSESFSALNFGDDVDKIRLSLYPSFRTSEGEETGTVWFDDIVFNSSKESNNSLTGGDFEVNIDSIHINLDFTSFDKAAERYLDDFGFNGFRLNLEGMGGGTYFSRTEGVFEGFEEGSVEYEKLMDQYLSKIQYHLKEKGWLGKEYIYWFDEPGKQDYPFVRKGMELIKSSAPELTTFITENDPGPEIMDVTDVTCTILHRVDPSKVKIIRDKGQQYWSYVCTGPKSPWISEFIDHDAINLRMWLWMSYSYRLNGILIWSTNYWTSRSASPEDYLQNPWTETASYVQGYGWPLGKQTNWGNGDGRFWYPPNRNPNTDKSTYVEGPVPSIRLEFLRQGIEDFEYFTLLENLIRDNKSINQNITKRAKSLLSIPDEIFADGKTYTKNPADLLEYRQKIAEMILEIINKTK